MRIQLLGREDPLEKEMATHSGKSHGERSLGATVHGAQTVGHDRATEHLGKGIWEFFALTIFGNFLKSEMVSK